MLCFVLVVSLIVLLYVGDKDELGIGLIWIVWMVGFMKEKVWV